MGRPAASQVLLRGPERMRTVGPVTRPGAFVGVLPAQASVVVAGAVQLFDLVALLAVQEVSVVVPELPVRGVPVRRTGRAWG